MFDDHTDVPSSSPSRFRAAAVAFTLAAVILQGALAQAQHRPTHDIVKSSRGMVVSVSGPASDAGAAVLKQGGNAVDAAIATAFALAATYPAAGNIGGGGFMVVWPGDGRPPMAFDFREKAPAAATQEMFVNPAGRSAHRRVGVPGTVSGLALAHEKLGTKPWKELVDPAVKLAANGFELDQANASQISELLKDSTGPEHAELHRVFDKPGGGDWKTGDRLQQPDLARSLERVRDRGVDGFYKGETAELIAAEMKRFDGIITTEDLANYQAKQREPVRGTYRGYDLVCMSPPCSGGITLISILNILENFEFARDERWSPRTMHLFAEAMKRAYRDRARYLGDPDFTEIPTHFYSKEHAREWAKGIDLSRATPSSTLAGDIKLAGESEHTTHFSVVDGKGMCVALTYTLESSFGSRVVAKGAGFILNDEMNDFNWMPGVTDSTGRIGTAPNLLAPGKRMLSSMCPTIVLKDGKPWLVTGSPGGRTIINTVLQVITGMIDFGLTAQEAVDAPRIHHQWFPDKIRAEAKFHQQHADVVKILEGMGHTFDRVARQGDAHSIWLNPETGDAESGIDPRISGKASIP
ncbi:Gamma-glutamyltranspeptidase precursor [Caulifigura coniformis]|uniref:Glutathione hydrolase proenzyme n=1 Tax=Caulifigura coniformis TaxID=2527983 RepID=A0A517SAH0_9PLAN|nr:gamma-glutamyltransferase [Caulifigura coniformis]QDT53119.1 Gamma-glutamyltranspeptidase precursor [Caulifigura coniformis]